ncbi:IS1634 family transposase [Planomonospora parontospora]|uniref:IS1634 family transposase n=1 Tax=Planomonospora parontospora TaxID=58119 RepID=UPI001670030A|nr:IS1634 family transposase [Planomonospora parontospora]GGL60172.1 transposase [Planomonospora parontospora subsp. antibiotica]GII20378.1 transposase [Planomonospora parontospora subsp. antibiotica]
MYLRSTPRRNKDGTEVRYLQLAHNVWDPVLKRSKVQVVYNFGREDAANREALQRLIASLTRFLDPDAALSAATDGPAFTESRPLGGTWVLDALWRQLEIGKVMKRLLKGRRLDPAAERVLFALVANRALAPCSKLAAARWVNEDVAIDGLPATSDDACYRAMDWLIEISAKLEEEVFHQVANLLNLEVDLLFFDTTSTYFETEDADEAVPRDAFGQVVPEQDATDDHKRKGFRSFGKSKDHRDDLPQVVIGMAVTRTGIPVRVWSWPGATGDSALIRQVKDDMRDWTLSRIVWVADRGFASERNRLHLRKGDHHYIIGEKLRSGSAEATDALARQGRYQEIRDNLRVKEVRIREDERFIICFNPEAAQRDEKVRERLLARLTTLIEGTDQLNATKRAELRGVISTKPGLNRYLRTTPGGLLRIDAARIKAEENLDGKYLLRTSDPKMTPEDIALGYKQLLEVERGWRDMKQIIDLRPVFHRKEQRIRAHVLLCWLALLLARIAETSTGQTWPTLRRELDRITLGTFTGPAGTFQQRTEITKSQRDLLHALKIDAPPRIYQLTPPSR